MTLIFHRQAYTQLWITVQADEPLALLSTAYLEDYFGVDGQLTLRDMSDDTRTPILMSENTSITPSIAHDVFEGFVDLSTVSNGLYRVEGRLRDSLGHYKILSEFQSPLGTEEVQLFEIEINDDDIIVYAPKQASVRLASAPVASVLMQQNNYSLSVMTNPLVAASVLHLQKPIASVKNVPVTAANVNQPSVPKADITLAYVL